jgi:hypothetical protein
MASKLPVGLSTLEIIVLLAIIFFGFRHQDRHRWGGRDVTILRFWPWTIWPPVVLVLLGVITFGYLVNGEEICASAGRYSSERELRSWLDADGSDHRSQFVPLGSS